MIDRPVATETVFPVLNPLKVRGHIHRVPAGTAEALIRNYPSSLGVPFFTAHLAASGGKKTCHTVRTMMMQSSNRDQFSR